MMTLGSLFDGIGGFPLAAVHCGGVPVWASEIEPFPMRVTKLRFPDMIHVGDITKLDGAKLPPVDVICGARAHAFRNIIICIEKKNSRYKNTDNRYDGS